MALTIKAITKVMASLPVEGLKSTPGQLNRHSDFLVANHDLNGFRGLWWGLSVILGKET